MSASANPSPSSERIQPFVALRALRSLIRDPDDTTQVFHVIDALSGNNGALLFERFRNSEKGARLLSERPDLLAVLSDRERLLALPPRSLGRVYGEFMRREQISADGLVDASEAGGREPEVWACEDRRWFGERLRDMHDLWHVATGYDRDLVGESSLLAFTYAQLRNRGIGLIVAAAYWKAGNDHPEARGLILNGYRRGKRAAWLPEQEWEKLLERPLEAVRRELGLGDPPVYEQVRSEGAPALAV